MVIFSISCWNTYKRVNWLKSTDGMESVLPMYFIHREMKLDSEKINILFVYFIIISSMCIHK